MSVSIQELINTVSNERSCPVLLPFNSGVIDAVNEQIKTQKVVINSMKENIRQLEEIQQKFYHAKELEVLRWCYLVRVYLTTRFKKIQTMVGKLIIPAREKLSDIEINYLETFEQSFVSALNEGEVTFSPEEEDLRAFVFFRALSDLGSNMMSSSETNEAINLVKNQIYFARFQHVKQFVEDGRVVLI